MLLNMLFDDEDEGSVSALFQVGDIVVQLKQRPTEGRVLNKEKEELQDYVRPFEAARTAFVALKPATAAPSVGNSNCSDVLTVHSSSAVAAAALRSDTPPRIQGTKCKGTRVPELVADQCHQHSAAAGLHLRRRQFCLLIMSMSASNLWCPRLQAMAHPEESCLPQTADGEYDSAFPNVGLVVWQAGFVLGEWLLRAKPLGPWGKPLRVLELGCGIGGGFSKFNSSNNSNSSGGSLDHVIFGGLLDSLSAACLQETFSFHEQMLGSDSFSAGF
jgi:hypothetical protein